MRNAGDDARDIEARRRGHQSARIPRSRGLQSARAFRPQRRATLCSAATLILALSALLTGCSGSGRVELISLNMRAIDPPTPNVGRLRVDECYWCENDAGEVCVALQRQQASWWGQLSFQMSLLLEKPPSGAARNYLVGQDELRAAVRLGPMESRFVSADGIVALYREPGDRLRGSYRLRVQREASRLLGGWSKPSSYLMLGEFTAVHDPDRGQPILTATEPAGWERD